MLAAPACWWLALAAAPAGAQSLDELREMSIEDLASVSVTSVSKSDQPLGDAPAAIYVISREDIVRSGAATLPEMLRLAPNLQVYQTSPGQWVVTARGLNGNRAAQSFSNKLLVLVDGRTVYTPLFSGVYWDMPDVLPDNIDRIEVISGPGATLWGSNAVNGVINVITRDAAETPGFYADLRAGPDRQIAGLRLGGSAGDDLSYRVHARAMREDAFLTPDGGSAQDPWRRIGGGFRLDWKPSQADSFSAQGEVFDGRLDRPGTDRETMSGHSLVLQWNRRTSDTGELQVQAFYDRIARAAPDGGDFRVDTYDADLQYSVETGGHRLVAGAGGRLAHYLIDGTASFYFEPPSRDLFIANAFVQDSFAVTPSLSATAGLKLEHLPFAGVSVLPEFRLAWKPAAAALVWGSVARAVRSPTPFDVDVEERAGPISLSGNPAFRTEKLTAFELGTRMQPARTVSFSATLFYHRYDDLRTVELVPGPGLSLGWDNGLEGKTYGLEAWADWQPAPWWKLAGGVTVLETDFTFKPGASGILGTAQLGTDPPYTGTLRSSMNLGSDVTFDLQLRAIGALRGSAIPAYEELGGRIAWRAAPRVTLSLAGANLLHDSHLEYPGADAIPRRIMAGAELAF